MAIVCCIQHVRTHYRSMSSDGLTPHKLIGHRDRASFFSRLRDGRKGNRRNQTIYVCLTRTGRGIARCIGGGGISRNPCFPV